MTMIPVPNSEQTCARLKDLREQNHISHKELASLAFVTEQATYKWEKGTIPSLNTLAILSSLYHVSINDLVVFDYVAVS